MKPFQTLLLVLGLGFGASGAAIAGDASPGQPAGGGQITGNSEPVGISLLMPAIQGSGAHPSKMPAAPLVLGADAPSSPTPQGGPVPIPYPNAVAAGAGQGNGIAYQNQFTALPAALPGGAGAPKTSLGSLGTLQSVDGLFVSRGGGTPAGAHVGGVNVLMGDGSVRGAAGKGQPLAATTGPIAPGTGGVNAGFSDGSVRFLQSTITPASPAAAPGLTGAGPTGVPVMDGRQGQGVLKSLDSGRTLQNPAIGPAGNRAATIGAVKK